MAGSPAWAGIDPTRRTRSRATARLPREQAPLLPGLKLSILDVRCRERGGAVFVVEMQVLPVTGFLNRVVFNACKAYVGTLERGKRYDTLTDVVAVSICDFTLWPDRAGSGGQRAHRRVRRARDARRVDPQGAHRGDAQRRVRRVTPTQSPRTS